MRITLLTLLIISFIDTLSYAQKSLPLKTAVAAFFERYEYRTNNAQLLRFEHRPDGWYAVKIKYDQTVDQRVKFYDRSTGNYLTLPETTFFDNKKQWDQQQPSVTGDQRAEEFLRGTYRFEREAFERQPYYGYRGWYRDAIAHWEQKPTLDDEQLHALARAYSIAANALLADYSGYGLPAEQFELAPERPALDDAQLEQYRQAIDRCLTAYAELKIRAPDFPTPVGPARLKYANERINAFVTLLYLQGEAAARTVLEDNLYPEYLLTQARNYLGSCPEDAVLLTYGDNDSFVFWYLQAMTGYRTDVIVANLSMLNLERYRRFLAASPFGAAPLRQGLPDFYQYPPIKLWLRPQELGEIFSYPQLLQHVYQEASHQQDDNVWLLTLPADQCEIPPPPTDGAYLDAAAKRVPIYWQPFKDNSSQSPSGYFPYDVLAANAWQRPLCFMPTVRAAYLKPWEQHLAWNGWVYQVVPDRLEDNNVTAGITHFTPASDTLWQTAFLFDTTTVIQTVGIPSFHQHQLQNAGYYLTHLATTEQPEAATAFLHTLPHRYPNHVRPWDEHWLRLIELAQQFGEDELADHIVKTIRENIDNDRIKFSTAERRVWLLSRLERR